MGSAGSCGPDDGPQCPSCIRFQSQVAPTAACAICLGTGQEESGDGCSKAKCKRCHGTGRDASAEAWTCTCSATNKASAKFCDDCGAAQDRDIRGLWSYEGGNYEVIEDDGKL